MTTTAVARSPTQTKKRVTLAPLLRSRRGRYRRQAPMLHPLQHPVPTLERCRRRQAVRTPRLLRMLQIQEFLLSLLALLALLVLLVRRRRRRAVPKRRLLQPLQIQQPLPALLVRLEPHPRLPLHRLGRLDHLGRRATSARRNRRRRPKVGQLPRRSIRKPHPRCRRSQRLLLRCRRRCRKRGGHPRCRRSRTLLPRRCWAQTMRTRASPRLSARTARGARCGALS